MSDQSHKQHNGEPNLADKYDSLLYAHDEQHPLVDVLNQREQDADELAAMSGVDAEYEDDPFRKGARTDQRSSLGDSFCTPDRKTAAANKTYAEGSDRLFGDETVPFTHIKEKPWHRALAYFAAQGLNAKEQCMKFGGEFDPQTRAYVAGSGQHAYGTIVNINRQPWFKQRVIDTLREAGSDQLGAFLESEVMPSLQTLIQLRDSPKTPASVRQSSARELLDRFLGKPQQPYVADDKNRKDPEQEAKELEAEIARLNTTETSSTTN